jgi:tetratricopeptide (TPR) repeat protein
MALVYRDLGRADDARAALRMALAVPTNSAEDRVAILYELGGLAQEHQDWEGALQAFQKAASLDPSFRDVSKRIQFVQARRAG